MKRKQEPRQALSVVYPDSAGIDVGSREHFVCGPVGSGCAADSPVCGVYRGLVRAGKVVQVLRHPAGGDGSDRGLLDPAVRGALERMGFEVVLVNGRQTKRPAARKSDVLDVAGGSSEMMMFRLPNGVRCGQADALCAIRAVVRLRARLIRDGQRAVQQMDKALVQMNAQLGRLLADLAQAGAARRSSAPRPRRTRRSDAEAANSDRRVRSSPEWSRGQVRNWRDEHLLELFHALAIFDLIQAHIAECDSTIAQAVAALQRLPDPPPEARGRSRQTKRHTAAQHSSLRTALLFQAMGVDWTGHPDDRSRHGVGDLHRGRTRFVAVPDLRALLRLVESGARDADQRRQAPGPRADAGHQSGRRGVETSGGERAQQSHFHRRRPPRPCLSRMTKACASQSHGAPIRRD